MKQKIHTKSERRSWGKALRDKCPRSAHSEWSAHARRHNVIDLLEESNSNRIEGLIPLRYGRMAQSPFAFFRGSAIIQARDLMKSPASGIKIQICGDCHLMNFGGFATPERSLVFDINDFDETLPGPWEWDVKRLAASFVLSSRESGFPRKAAADAVRAAVESYRKHMAEYYEMKLLDIWYTQIKASDLLDYFRGNKDMTGRIEKKTKEALSRTSEAVYPKLVEVKNGKRRIVDNPPYIYHFAEIDEDFRKLERKFIDMYKTTLQPDRRELLDRYHFEDVVIKVVGVGSVGTRCAVSLYVADDDPLFLQIKEARRSVLEPPGKKSRVKHQGERVVTGQRLMQAAGDMFLGWSTIPGGHHYYMRQLRDMKVSPEPGTFLPKTLASYAEMCGWALARAHAKAGDPATITGYLGPGSAFDDAIVEYAEAYADQVEADFETFKQAISHGKIKTDTDAAPNLGFLL